MTWLQNAFPFIGIVLMSQRTSTGLTPQQYRLIDQRLTWHEAQSFCRVKHADLATVADMDDKNRLVDALGAAATPRWIGLRRGGSRRWMWSDGSGGVSFSMWGEGEPSGGEWCGELSDTGSWNDLSCEDAKGYVCYNRRQDGGRDYVHYSQAQSWAKGQELCRSGHTDMAYIGNHGENSHVANMVKTWTGLIFLPNTVWIGLFNDAWAWSDGSGASFRYWVGGSPGQGDCASVSTNGRWVAANCNDQATFVCQGGLKVKRKVIRVKVRSDVNLADSTVSDELLKKIETGFKDRLVTDFTLSWRRNPNGIAFRREAPSVVAKATGC